MATDNIYLTGKLEGGIRDIHRAAALTHNLIYNEGDDEHIKWMADKLVEGTRDLIKDFEEALAAKHATFRG